MNLRQIIKEELYKSLMQESNELDDAYLEPLFLKANELSEENYLWIIQQFIDWAILEWQNVSKVSDHIVDKLLNEEGIDLFLEPFLIVFEDSWNKFEAERKISEVVAWVEKHNIDVSSMSYEKLYKMYTRSKTSNLLSKLKGI